MAPLVRPLRDGPLDVIGDVHGELNALHSLLSRLGYDPQRGHPHGRQLIFVGDLCDRGPDSPGVIRLVQSLVDAGHAMALIGNHELNLLRREERHGDDWFYGIDEDPEYGRCVPLSESERADVLQFLGTLPLALERSDIRIVHAAWVDNAIDECRGMDEPVDVAFDCFEDRMRTLPEFVALRERYEEECAKLGNRLNDRSERPAANHIGPFDAYRQARNPLRCITGGPEDITRSPYFAAGRWRYSKRIAWWHHYAGPIPALFGHYWRGARLRVPTSSSFSDRDLFESDGETYEMRSGDLSYCVDFSVGLRNKERRLGLPPPYEGRLAAMRWPERSLVFDE